MAESSIRESKAEVIRVPSVVQHSIIRYSSTYNQRQVDNYYNLVQNRNTHGLCQICLEASTQAEVQKLPNCGHTFCQECLHNYLLYRIQVGYDTQCPLASCKGRISQSHSSYKELPPGYKDRHKKNKTFRQNFGQSSTVPCQKKDCKGSVNFSEGKPKCSECGQAYCKKCHLMAHEGSCEDDYGLSFREWRRCPSCKKFNQKGEDNKMKCQCSMKFCSVCMGEWNSAHRTCQQEIDPLLQNIYCKPNIVKCCRCWNCFSSIFYIILFPFLLVLVAIVLLLTFIGTILGGFLCSCYYSRMEGYALWASILCCPCLGVFSVAHAVGSFFGEMVKVSSGSVKKYCRTISALCCYSKPKRQSVDDMQSNKLEF